MKGGDYVLRVTDLLNESCINDSNMDEFKSIHPKQLISLEIPVPIWKIHYSYCTARGNPKKADKYIIDYESAWDRVDNTFMQHIKEQNEKYPERKLSNVEILDSFFMGEVILELE